MKYVTWSFVAAAAPSILLAQVSGPYAVPQIVVTATRIPQDIGDVLRPVTVITAQDIERSGQLTLTQVLQTLGGVEIAANGGQGSASSVFMRGANSDHTLVLVDGIRLQSATTGTTAFENVPLSQIERIEIVPGPSSSLYGSDAIGGTIQIFTKGGRGVPSAQASVSYGSYNTRDVRAAASTAYGATDFALSGGYVASDSFSATNPHAPFGAFNPDRDPYRNASASAKVSHRFGENDDAGATAFYSAGDTHFDDGPDTDPHTRQKLAVYSVYSRNTLARGWESLLRVGGSRDDSTTFDVFGGRFRTDESQATWQNSVKAPGGTAIAGAEYVRQRIASDTAYAVNARTARSIFAGYNGEWGRHAVQASVRKDDNSQFGDPGTGTVAYGLRPLPALRLRASYGTAFHAPTFNDLYYPGFGNDQLRPERSHSAEGGLDYEAGVHRFAATYFENRIRDLIVFAADPATGNFLPQNVSRARIRGTELSYTGKILKADVRAKFTIQDPRSLPSGALLQRRAKRFGSAAASRTLGRWRFGAELVASGARFDSPDESAGSRMGGYAVVNLLAAYAISPRWNVDLRWNNVADKKYELVQGYNTPASNLLLTLHWSPIP